MPRAKTTKPAAVPGDTSPKTQARAAEEARDADHTGTPNVTSTATAATGNTETVHPTRDTARPDTGKQVKTTAPLRGDSSQQMAALMARIAEVEQGQRDLAARNADLESQLRQKTVTNPPAKSLPTVEKAQAMLDEATTAEGRRPVLSRDGWVVHPHAFETPNGDLAKALKALH